MSNQTFYFKNFERVPGKKLNWKALDFSEYMELKIIMLEELK